MPVVLAAANLAPAGLFAAQTYVAGGGPPGILADAIDPRTGELLSIRRGMDPIDAQVLLALRVRRRSGAAVMEDGQTYDEIRTVDDTTAGVLMAKTRLFLKRLLDNGDIAIVALAAAADPGDASGAVELQYRNLRRRRAPVRTLRILPP